MTDRFDLEQEILACWGMTSDLDLIIEQVIERDCTRDELANLLIGVKALHNLRCEKLFATFETLVHDGVIGSGCT